MSSKTTTEELPERVVAARMIAALAAASSAKVMTGSGVISISEALDETILIGDLIRMGLKMISGGGTWSLQDDDLTARGMPVSVIGFAFDYALEIAPVEGGAISPRALAAIIAYIESVDGPMIGYPQVAADCADYAYVPGSAPDRSGV